MAIGTSPVRAPTFVTLLLLLLTLWQDPLTLADGRRFGNLNHTSGADLDDDQPVNFNRHTQHQLAETAVNRWRDLANKKPDRDLLFGVLFNDDPDDRLVNKPMILTAIQMAVERVQRADGLLAGFNITIEYRNTNGSSVNGPLEAIMLYLKHKPDLFLGPVSEYVLAPVARYGQVWELPIISPGGYNDGFRIKEQNFPMLTTILPSSRSMVPMVLAVLRQFGWHHVSIIYQNDLKLLGRGESRYSFLLGSLFNNARDEMIMKTTVQVEMSDITVGREKYLEHLRGIMSLSRSE